MVQNPFNGIERSVQNVNWRLSTSWSGIHSMELKGSYVERNFNLILCCESIQWNWKTQKSTVSAAVYDQFTNPFNGIERAAPALTRPPPPPRGIHSMELKGQFRRAYLVAKEENPFNGIESTSTPRRPAGLGRPESIQWNWK